MSENSKSEGWWHTVPGLLTALAGIITAVTGLLVALHQVGFFAREDITASTEAKIHYPLDQSEVYGRYVKMSGVVKPVHASKTYWIAIHPTGAPTGVWWPQRHRLNIRQDGAWKLEVALGRDFPEGRSDIGRIFTIALFEVNQSVEYLFAQHAEQDAGMQLPEQCRMLDVIVVKRIG